MVKNKSIKILNWHIVFVQYCNLKCSYCSTGFGKFGEKEPAYMKENTWKKLTGWIFADPGKNEKVSLCVEGGETLLKFEPFFEFVQYLYKQAKKQDIQLSIVVGTNGIFSEKNILDSCAKYRIGLNFSIDGSEETHNRYRKDKNGCPTHETALKNWKYYKKIAQDSAVPINCSIQSVFTGHSSLVDMLKFWENQGEKIVNITVQQPSRFVECKNDTGWDKRRGAYLEDFKKIAYELATVLTIPGFLSNFSGPQSLYKIWKDIFLGTSVSPCGAGINTLGVTASGDLYPCETFIGNNFWKLGNIFNGIDEKKLQTFQASRKNVLEACKECETGSLCCGGCFRAGQGDEIILNSEGGCLFMKEIIKIARDSYSMMEEEI